jgi:hypothetical protein
MNYFVEFCIYFIVGFNRLIKIKLSLNPSKFSSDIIVCDIFLTSYSNNGGIMLKKLKAV